MDSPAASALLVVLFGGFLLKGYREPWPWAAAAVAVWLAALAHPRALVSRPAAFWGLWLGWSLLSAASSRQPLSALEPLSAWAGALAFFAAARSLWGETQRRRWFWGLCALAAVLALAALWTSARRGWEPNELYGLLPYHYNYTAFALAAAGAAAWAGLGHPHSPRGRWRPLLWAVLALSGGMLLLARARGALLALAVSAAALAWRQGRLKALARPALALGAAALCVTAGLMAVKGVSPAYLLKLDKAGAFKRPQIWAASLAVAAERPLLGEGPGQFAAGFRRHNFPSGLGWARYQFSSAHAHSEPLQIAAETGLAGLALFLLSLAASFRARGFREASWTQEAGLGAFAAMSAHLLVENALHLPGLALLYFSALACACPASLREPSAPRWARPAALAAAGLGLALALAAWVPRRLASRLEGSAAAVRLFPAEPSLRQALARTRLVASPPDREGALRELEEASRLEPTNAWHLMMRAQVHWEDGERGRAVELAQRALELEPRFVGARLLKAQALLDAERLPDARAELAAIEWLAAEGRRAAASGGLWTPYERRLAEVHGPTLERLRRRLAR